MEGFELRGRGNRFIKLSLIDLDAAELVPGNRPVAFPSIGTSSCFRSATGSADAVTEIESLSCCKGGLQCYEVRGLTAFSRFFQRGSRLPFVRMRFV